MLWRLQGKEAGIFPPKRPVTFREGATFATHLEGWLRACKAEWSGQGWETKPASAAASRSGHHPNPSTPVTSTKHRPWLWGLATSARLGFSVLWPDHTESIPEHPMSSLISQEKCNLAYVKTIHCAPSVSRPIIWCWNACWKTRTMTSQAPEGHNVWTVNRLFMMQICDFRSDFTNIMGTAIWLISSNVSHRTVVHVSRPKMVLEKCYREKAENKRRKSVLSEDIVSQWNFATNDKVG